MNTNLSVGRDERTLSVENASYRWAYSFLAYALLVDAIYRGIVFNEAAWDLIALVILGGVVGSLYQARQKILTSAWIKQAVFVTCLGGLIGLIVSLILIIS